MSGRLVVLVNPTAGGGRADATWTALLRNEPRLAAARVVAGPDADAALAELEEVLRDGPADRLVVVGGDGTLSRVGDFLLKRDAPAPPLGLVPAGTGSDLARALGLPREPGAALAQALTGSPRPIDALELRAADGRWRFVLNIASAGISGEVDRAVAGLVHRGKTAYLGATLGALFRYRPAACRITLDGEPWHEGEILLLAVANGTTFGRGMKIAPEAKLDDGLADVVLVPRLPGWQVPIQLPRLYLGTHLGSRFVQHRRAERVTIEPLGPMPPFDLDGDPWPASQAELRVVPRALRILVREPESGSGRQVPPA